MSAPEEDYELVIRDIRTGDILNRWLFDHMDRPCLGAGTVVSAPALWEELCQNVEDARRVDREG